MASEDSTISKACFTLHEMTEDEKIREQCLARMRYELDRNSAIRNGFDKGFSQGLEAGTEAGKKIGMEIGMEAGMEAGMAAGMEAGMAAGKSELISTLLQSGMTLDELSKRLNMSLDEVQKLASSTLEK